MVLSLTAGLLLLLVGGEMLVRGAVETARQLQVSPLIIGVTLVGLGTSAPELVTCVSAALRDAPGIAIGNIIGSNIANILLILAIGALLRPVICCPTSFKRDGLSVVLSTIACAAVMITGHISRTAGLVLLLALAGYLIWATLDDRRLTKADQPDDSPPRDGKSLVIHLGMTLLGLAGIALGADFMVKGAINLASVLGVSETLIGLTVIAIGTSLPELATTIMAAVKRQGDIAFGNVIGSNIFNSLGILGATAMVKPIDVPGDVAFDIWVMLGATAALILFAVTSWRINRVEGGLLLAGYVGYIGTVSVAL